MTRLYVGNLPFETTEGEIQDLFSQSGQVTDVALILDRVTGRPRGFAFVTMATTEQAQAAAEKFNGFEMGGRPLKVNEARPKDDKPGFGGGGGGGGFGGPRRDFGGPPRGDGPRGGGGFGGPRGGGGGFGGPRGGGGGGKGGFGGGPRRGFDRGFARGRGDGFEG